MTTDSQARPGWYADQNAPGQERFWNGASWTDQRRPAASTLPAPLELKILEELRTANRLLAGIRDRTGVVAAVILVSLALALLSVAAQH